MRSTTRFLITDQSARVCANVEGEREVGSEWGLPSWGHPRSCQYRYRSVAVRRQCFDFIVLSTPLLDITFVHFMLVF